MNRNTFFLIFLIILSTLSISIVAALDCPIGLINDTAPGSCGLYVDKNADALCDLSEPGLVDSCDTNISITDLTSEQIKSMSVGQVADYYKIDKILFVKKIAELANTKVNGETSFQLLHDNYGVKPVYVREIALELQNGVLSNDKVVVSESVKPKTNHLYNAIWLSIITIILYVSTWFLSARKIISLALHRKIWNWLLLIAFIPVLLTALFWLLRVDYNIIVALPLNITFWHVEFGIVMIWISLFHIAWHVRYYVLKK